MMSNELHDPNVERGLNLQELDPVLLAELTQEEAAEYIQDVSLQLFKVAKCAELDMIAHLISMIVVEAQDPRRSAH